MAALFKERNEKCLFKLKKHCLRKRFYIDNIESII